ncbi:Sirohydrochlorin cobaltochelatase [Thalassoglobus neptunius]|uniref:Sirohydrochlorin cobaltochelatase n=1 Tax=Thalassoglobus neptunius TaxID=1938619 RepID=A0A5C5WX14_9PLAN|nr:CbiX/SirB N-terminal domain-containing protein [Thalassoglobus neptunius]TWT55257.1 Sirohydrochlorin cobaltochelatase [Thalassoglobus neptunius]
MTSAILLVAHGSRRPEANADLYKLAELFKTEKPESHVEIGFLELTEPTIPQGLSKCAEHGATSIAILPYFLSQGTHVAEDLIRFRDQFQEQFPQVECYVCPPIGLHSKLVELMLHRLDEGTRSHQQQQKTS